MWWLPQLHRMGGITYLHIVRDVRTLSHMHIEIDARLWLDYYGGPPEFATAVSTALRSACAILSSPCHALPLTRRLCSAGDQVGREIATAGSWANRSDGYWLESPPLAWLGLVIGWADVHGHLAGDFVLKRLAEGERSGRALQPKEARRIAWVEVKHLQETVAGLRGDLGPL